MASRDGLVGREEHLHPGIDIVDEVKQGRLRSLGEHGRAKFQLSMVGGDQMKDVESDILRGGGELLPPFLREITPEGIHQFDADREVTEKFASEFRSDTKSTLRWAGLPKLTRVMEKHP